MIVLIVGRSVPMVVQSAQLVVAAFRQSLVDSVLGDNVLTCKIVAQVQRKIEILVLA